MKKYSIFMLCILLFGCVSLDTENDGVTAASAKARRNLTNIHQVAVGMTLSEVEGIMGDGTTIGYKISDVEHGSNEPIKINNPHRVEDIEEGGIKYKVVYYYTHVLRADGIIAEDELVPLVFDAKDILIGKGRDFLFKIKTES